MLPLLDSPLVLLPEEGVLHTLDFDDPELGLRHCLVEKAVHCPVAPVFTRDWHLQEVLAHRHWQPCFRKKAGWVGSRRREGMRRGEIHGWGRGRGGTGEGRWREAAQSPRQKKKQIVHFTKSWKIYTDICTHKAHTYIKVYLHNNNLLLQLNLCFFT